MNKFLQTLIFVMIIFFLEVNGVMAGSEQCINPSKPLCYDQLSIDRNYICSKCNKYEDVCVGNTTITCS